MLLEALLDALFEALLGVCFVGVPLGVILDGEAEGVVFGVVANLLVRSWTGVLGSDERPAGGIISTKSLGKMPSAPFRTKLPCHQSSSTRWNTLTTSFSRNPKSPSSSPVQETNVLAKKGNGGADMLMRERDLVAKKLNAAAREWCAH